MKQWIAKSNDVSVVIFLTSMHCIYAELISSKFNTTVMMAVQAGSKDTNKYICSINTYYIGQCVRLLFYRH